MMSATDAAAAATAGVDAIGMVFYRKAARCISIETAKEILAALPPFVTPVGLFVNASAEEILQTAQQVGLTTVQLHGRETPELVAQLRGFNVIKVLHVGEDFEATLEHWKSQIKSLQLTNIKALLLETASKDAPGGTGIENDWSAITNAQQKNWFEGLPPMVAAGGLTPENVGDVVRRIRPFAVDLSSGIEETKGKKSTEKMRQFVAAVSQADLENKKSHG